MEGILTQSVSGDEYREALDDLESSQTRRAGLARAFQNTLDHRPNRRLETYTVGVTSQRNAHLPPYNSDDRLVQEMLRDLASTSPLDLDACVALGERHDGG